MRETPQPHTNPHQIAHCLCAVVYHHNLFKQTHAGVTIVHPTGVISESHTETHTHPVRYFGGIDRTLWRESALVLWGPGADTLGGAIDAARTPETIERAAAAARLCLRSYIKLMLPRELPRACAHTRMLLDGTHTHTHSQSYGHAEEQRRRRWQPRRTGVKSCLNTCFYQQSYK